MLERARKAALKSDREQTAMWAALKATAAHPGMEWGHDTEEQVHCHEMDERLQGHLLEVQVEHDFKERELRENSMASEPASSSSAAAVGARFAAQGWAWRDAQGASEDTRHDEE